MCGIAGIIRFNPESRVDADRLNRMGDVLRHRGPDEKGAICIDNAGLAHRRLSIIDLAHGQQPITNADQSIWLTYNGEIYNFKALRVELRSRGCSFTTESDTEVVLRAYEVFGDRCVDHLQGMFAFAIWDRRKRRLFLARDRLGIKPLYYAKTGDQLLFGSEIKAILAADVITPVFNQSILPEFLANRYVAGISTFFKDIYKLLPGNTMTWSLEEGLREHCYWRPPLLPQESRSSMKECADEVRAQLEEAVRSHLVSDVPLGVFLSGGIDSTALAALASSMMSEPVRTFAVGFADRETSELGYARFAAESVGAEHREVVVSPEEFFEALPRLIWHEDEPIAFTSSVPLYFVSRLARDHVKVVLTGEGADELFLGYNRYRVTAWNQRFGSVWENVPDSVRGGVRSLVSHLPKSMRRLSERTFLALAPGVRGLFYENFAIFPEKLQQQLLEDQAILAARDPYAAGLHYYNEAASAGVLDRMSHADLQTYLVELLMKQDQMSMAASIESRVPFLDHKFVEYVVSLPSRYKLPVWQTKVVLREALRNVVPKQVLTRRKMGFPVPIGRWLQNEYWSMVEEFVLGPRALKRELFAPEMLKKIATEHRQGISRHDERLWLLVNLEIWQRIFIDGEAPSSVYANCRTPFTRTITEHSLVAAA